MFGGERLLIGKIILSVGLVIDFIGAFLLALSEIEGGRKSNLEKQVKFKSLIGKIAAVLLAFGFIIQLVGINLES